MNATNLLKLSPAQQYAIDSMVYGDSHKFLAVEGGFKRVGGCGININTLSSLRSMGLMETVAYGVWNVTDEGRKYATVRESAPVVEVAPVVDAPASVEEVGTVGARFNLYVRTAPQGPRNFVGAWATLEDAKATLNIPSWAEKLWAEKAFPNVFRWTLIWQDTEYTIEEDLMVNAVESTYEEDGWRAGHIGQRVIIKIKSRFMDRDVYNEVLAVDYERETGNWWALLKSKDDTFGNLVSIRPDMKLFYVETKNAAPMGLRTSFRMSGDKVASVDIEMYFSMSRDGNGRHTRISITGRERGGNRPAECGVNWPGCGTLSPADTRIFADKMVEAANLVEELAKWMQVY